MNLPESAGPGEILRWDSAFFGMAVGRWRGGLGASETDRLRAWACQESIDCLYFFCDGRERATLSAAGELGFDLVDLRLQFRRPLRDVPPASKSALHIRQAAPRDIPPLRAMSGGLYPDSRFYFDGGFPREQCDELYRVWIEQAVRRATGVVLVAEQSGRIAGYLSLLRRTGGPALVDLVGVTADCRGTGVGSSLVSAGLNWLQEAGETVVEVKTQGRNLAAARLYERSGFALHEIEYCFHWWPKGRPA